MFRLTSPTMVPPYCRRLAAVSSPPAANLCRRRRQRVFNRPSASSRTLSLGQGLRTASTRPLYNACRGVSATDVYRPRMTPVMFSQDGHVAHAQFVQLGGVGYEMIGIQDMMGDDGLLDRAGTAGSSVSEMSKAASACESMLISILAAVAAAQDRHHRQGREGT